MEFGADPNRMEKGNSAFVDEEYDSALTHYGDAIKADPASVPAYVNRSHTLYKLERYEGEGL